MATNIRLGNGISMIEYHDGSVGLSHDDHPVWSFGVTSHEEARQFAHAILAALGEPVETKPNRSELDAIVPWRFIAVEDDTREMTRFGRANSDLDALISTSKHDTARALTIYEAVAHIGKRPEPAERKVVRVQ